MFWHDSNTFALPPQFWILEPRPFHKGWARLTNQTGHGVSGSAVDTTFTYPFLKSPQQVAYGGKPRMERQSPHAAFSSCIRRNRALGVCLQFVRVSMLVLPPTFRRRPR